MKKLLILMGLMPLFAAGLSAQNPICPIGTYIADPSARVWKDGKLYIYGSTDEDPDYYCSHRHDVLYTSDLVHWKMEKNVFATKGENDAVKETDSYLFAPDIMYRNGNYYLYFCTPSIRYSEGVAVSKSPLGPFRDARKLNTGKYNEIDPTIFVDDDGQAYYYWGQFSLKAAKMKPGMTELDSTSIRDGVITSKEHFFHEGSFVFKRKGRYYVLYAHEGRRDNRPTCLGYATSDSPMGPFKYGGVVIDNFGCDPESWNNHGSIAEFKGQWYVFYHRSSQASVRMRRACMEPISFNEDGSIDEVEMTSQGAGKPLDAFSRIEAERACLLGGYCRIMPALRSIPENEAVTKIKSGDSATFKYLDFGKGTTGFKARLRSFTGGFINIRLDDAKGRIIGTLQVPPKSGSVHYQEYSCKVDKAAGVHALYLEFCGREQGTFLYDLDWLAFE